jgi:hypothetical protein
MTVEFEEVVRRLPKLTQAELSQVRGRCALLLQSKIAPVPALADEDWLLEGITTELHNIGIYVNTSFRVKKSHSFKGYLTKSEEVRKLLLEAAPGITLTERHYLGQIAARELIRYITWQDTSLNSLLDHIHCVPNALEKAFPGYLQSRNLRIIVQHKTISG